MQVSKYNASGNDFVIFHTFKEIDRSELARRVCDRQSGVGADGLIVILPYSKADFKWQFYNSDGSEANMCGNGSRACAHYAFINRLANKKMSFLTRAGLIECEVDKNIVKTKMTPHKKLKEPFVENAKEWFFYDTGVPHLVTFVENIESFDTDLARKMRNKYNANVNFAKVINNTLHVRTYERGVEAETLACGTGMVASFVSAYDSKKLKDSTKVYPKSQEELEIGFENGDIFFKGEVSKVFDTVVDV
jgi:diaminopimelate epimerase